MIDVEELIKKCMDSGWFRTEEAARRYVMANCIPKPEPEYPQEEIFINEQKEEPVNESSGNRFHPSSLDEI